MSPVRTCSKQVPFRMAASVLLFILFSAGPSGKAQKLSPAQSASGKSGRTKISAKKPPPDAPVPFRIGETLNYNVSWSAFSTAASVQFSVPERRELFGWGTWHFRVSVHTQSPVRSLFTIDDQVDSYTDAVTLECRQYETYLNEMGKKQDQVLHFLPEGQPSRGNLPGIVVSPGTRDPLGAIYALRSIDWEHTPEFRAPVYDGHDVYELRARLEVPAEKIAVASGSYSATRISIHVFHRGKELAGESFSAWLAHDAARTPVLMEASLPIGTLRMELTSASQ